MEKLPALMAASQVNLTGNPAAAWRLRTRAPMLGRSWELRAPGGVGVDVWIEETGLSSGQREKRHSLDPVVSLHLLSRTFFLYLEKTVTALLSNKTLQP